MKTLKSTIFSMSLALCAIAGAATFTAKSYESVPMTPDATLQVKPGNARVAFGETLCDGSPANILTAETHEKNGAFKIDYAVDSGRNAMEGIGCTVSRTPIRGNHVDLHRGQVTERDLDGFLLRFQG